VLRSDSEAAEQLEERALSANPASRIAAHHAKFFNKFFGDCSLQATIGFAVLHLKHHGRIFSYKNIGV